MEGNDNLNAKRIDLALGILTGALALLAVLLILSLPPESLVIGLVYRGF